LEFILYVLVFLFGYFTHRTFHSYTAAKTGSLIFLHGKLTSLLMLVRAIEKYNYVKSYGIIELQKHGATESELAAYKIIIDNDIDYFKRQSIKAINKPIPEYLKVLEHFESWDEAMMFLAKFKKEIPEELLYDKEN
tara:strand:+ start:131 stop:538 length:408 start_codon:yes stop_codon:yes gene_type:complete